jgi:serine/threonine-protein kinase
MGEVYLANHLALARPAAIKVLPMEFCGQHRARLQREGQAAARLQHPCIATFHELLEIEELTALVMEYVPGPTLRERLFDGALPIAQAVAFAVCLLEALAHAHAAGIIHRDIKPENIVVTGERSAKLLDFGIALQVPTEFAEDSRTTAPDERMTMAGIVVGTAGYMSPEQLRGEALDARSDLFAVGAVLYEMIDGSPAFPGSSRKARLEAILSRDPDPLTAEDCPRGLQEVVARALARDPQHRFSSARAFLTELKRTAGAFDVALPDTLAVLDFDNLSPDATASWIGSGLADRLSSDLAHIEGLHIVRRERVRGAHGALEPGELERPVAVGLRLGCRWVFSGGFRVAATHLWVSAQLVEVSTGQVLFEEAHDSTVDSIFEIERRLAASCAAALNRMGSLPPSAFREGPSLSAFEAYCRGLRMRKRLEKGSLDEARELYERAVDADPTYSAPLSELAAVHGLRFIFTTDPRELERALAYATRALAADGANAEAHVWNGYALYRLGRFEESLEAERRAMALDPSDFYAPYFGGATLLAMGRRRDAINLLQRAVEVGPDAGVCWLYLGCTQLCLNLLTEARYSLAKAHALEGGSDAMPGVAGYLGESLRRAKMLDAAHAHCLLGLDSVERSDHMYRDSIRAFCLCALGRTAIEAENPAAARAAFGQVVAQLHGRPRALGGGHLVVQALAGLARSGEGDAPFSEALRVFETRDGFNFQYFHGCCDDVTLLELARGADVVGRREEADALLRRAREAGSLEPFDATEETINDLATQ